MVSILKAAAVSSTCFAAVVKGRMGIMCVVAVGISDVTETQDVKLRLPTSTSGIDRKEDRPGDADSSKSDETHHLHESQVKEGIERVLLQDIGIFDFSHGRNPSEE